MSETFQYQIYYKSHPVSPWAYKTPELAIKNDRPRVDFADDKDVVLVGRDQGGIIRTSVTLEYYFLKKAQEALTATSNSGKIIGNKENDMCVSNPLVSDVRAVVDSLVNSGKTFTAFDVTKALEPLVGMRVPHRYVRPEVANLMDSGIYSGYDVRLNTNINGAPREWFPKAPAVQPVVPVAQSAPKVAAAPSVGGAKNEDGSRIRVFRDVLEAAGFKPGAKVKAIYSPGLNSVFLVPVGSGYKTNDPNATTKDYVVDVRQNVRVQLSTMGIPTSASVTGVSKVAPETLQISL